MRLLAADLLHQPYAVFSELRREAPVWRLPDENAYLVSTWDLVAEAASRVEDFSNRFRYALYSHEDGTLGALWTGGQGPDVFAGTDPPDHTAHRRIFFPELVQHRIETLEPYVTDLADDLLDALLADERGDAARDLAHVLPIRVVAERVIGFRDPDVDAIRRWIFDGSRIMGGLMTLEEMAEWAAAGDVAGLVSFTDAQLDAAIDRPPSGDVLSAAAAAVRDGVLNREQAAFTLMVLVGAGAETTTGLIGTAISLLAQRPALQDELRRAPEKVPAFIEEVLRFESPFLYHPRTASRATQLGGIDIPEGALVLLLWGAANRDASVFDDPDELQIDRANTHLHFGFGRGIHHCVGAPLARLEARVVLTRLLERTASFTPDPHRAARWAESVWVRRLEELPLVVSPPTVSPEKGA
ncbi:MAG: cytochrome P450 [Acidimicrobiales bacterium]